MSDNGALLDFVPFGEENAVNGRLIWLQYGMWSSTGIRHKLNAMAAEGLIERKMVGIGAAQKSLYFRKMPTGS